MTNVTIPLLIENLSPKSADRLVEGEWVILGNRVARLTSAGFCGLDGFTGMVDLRFEFLARRMVDGKVASAHEQTMLVDRKTMFPCLDISV